MDNDIMTIKEVSEYLKLNEKTAYRLTLDGKLPAFKVGGSWRFRKSQIDKWIAEQEAKGDKGKE
ncbi:MAG: DNA-binding protein [Micavibrio sp.]|jgi:excisionase family DNA binding protein|nr:DNA-binding protein [Micavibrio sp.]|tara:strand:- start:790 stop:981 length:192 start_codon:yes stop_codon:yes gene_type:complete